MFQTGSVDELPKGPPPPIPPRNPLRHDAHHLETHNLLPNKDDSGAVISQGRSTLRMIAESSRENVDAYPEIASPRHAHREFMLDVSSVRRRPQPDRALHRPSSVSDDGGGASLVSQRSSWTNGPRPLSSVVDRSTAPTMQGPGVGSKMQNNIEQGVANLQIKLDDAESLTTISSYDDGSRLENTTENIEEDSRVEAWLRRGTIDTQSLESDCTSLANSTPKSPSLKKLPTLNIFPPTSPKTGKREYVCPSSPLNNGRDAYGNYITTNTQDYLTARRMPSSPKLQSVVEDTGSYGKSSTAHLRGGGGWWHTLGFGFDEKESPQAKQPEVVGAEPRHKPTPAQSLRAKRQLGSTSQYATSVLSNGAGSDVGSSVVKETSDSTSHHPTIQAPFVNQHALKTATGQNLNNQSLKTDSILQHPLSRTHSSDNHEPTWPQQRPRPSYEDTLYHTSFSHQPASINFSKASKKAESPWSGVSYTPRTNKKWNQEPASGPPSAVAMLPPPPLKHTRPDSEIASSVGVLSPTKYRYERPPSPTESYNDQAWELQSLQLGESVSVAGGQRRTIGGANRSRNIPFDPEEFEAAQKIAQVEFRPLCQDVMARYNAEMSRNQRALREETITPEQYKRQVDFQVQNKEKALKHSAASTGYVILTSEFSILESLSSPDSYAIYHSLLSSTNPALWHSLAQQHLMAQNMQAPSPSVSSRNSSLDQARHVAGKIARFVLAAPSDPALKTHSMRGKKMTGAGMLPLAWMDPLAVHGLTGVAGQDEEVVSGMMDEKGKGKAETPMSPPGTSTRDSAMPHTGAGQSRTADATTTALNTNTRFTSSTARTPPPLSAQARLIHAEIQRAYKPIEKFPGKRDSPSRMPGGSTAAKNEPTTTEPAPTEVSQQSMWPEGDAQGNWWVPKGSKSLKLRGGKGKERKEKKTKIGGKKPWLEGWRAEAMYANGSFG